MQEEWISLNEYMRRYHMGYEVITQMINNKEIESKKTPGGHYKIKIGGNTVSIETFEQEKERRIKAETTLKLLQNILLERELDQ